MSSSLLRPLQGVAYLATHSNLWPPLFSRIIPCILLSIGVLVPMFLFAYLPQAAVLTVLNGPLGPFSAVMLVLSESGVLITTLAKAFLLEGALLDVFDATLVEQGQEALVSRGRELKANKSRMDGVKKLGKVVSKPLNRFSPAAILQYVITLPLTLIPIVGTPLFILYQAYKTGPSYHSRYFNLKSFSGPEKDRFVKDHRSQYTQFGLSASLLNLVPFASIIFAFSDAVGAALWAAQIEKGGASVEMKPSGIKKDL